MVDNTILNPGTGGDTVASDDIGGIKHQRVKITQGANGVDDGDVSKTNPLPTTRPTKTPIDISGTITLGGTAQQLVAANANRTGFMVQNNSDALLWISEIATAVENQPSIQIPIGETYICPEGACGVGAISIVGPTTGKTFTAREW